VVENRWKLNGVFFIFKEGSLMRKNKRGFSLVEILIVVAIISILVSVALPALLRSRINANESASKANLQAFATAMESYRTAQTTPAYALDINALTTSSPPYLDSTWGTGTTATKSGYNFTYVRTDGSRYVGIAEPSSATITGNNSFCVDETGVLWTSATSSGAFTVSPCSSGTGATSLV
jgi:type IV pilus assembly protein PilA